MEKEQRFQHMVLRLDVHMGKKWKEWKFGVYLSPSKWASDLNRGAKILKCLEENMGVNLRDLEYNNEFLRYSQKLKAHTFQKQINWISWK